MTPMSPPVRMLVQRLIRMVYGGCYGHWWPCLVLSAHGRTAAGFWENRLRSWNGEKNEDPTPCFFGSSTRVCRAARSLALVFCSRSFGHHGKGHGKKGRRDR